MPPGVLGTAADLEKFLAESRRLNLQGNFRLSNPKRFLEYIDLNSFDTDISTAQQGRIVALQDELKNLGVQYKIDQFSDINQLEAGLRKNLLITESPQVVTAVPTTKGISTLAPGELPGNLLGRVAGDIGGAIVGAGRYGVEEIVNELKSLSPDLGESIAAFDAIIEDDALDAPAFKALELTEDIGAVITTETIAPLVRGTSYGLGPNQFDAYISTRNQLAGEDGSFLDSLTLRPGREALDELNPLTRVGVTIPADPFNYSPLPILGVGRNIFRPARVATDLARPAGMGSLRSAANQLEAIKYFKSAPDEVRRGTLAGLLRIADSGVVVEGDRLAQQLTSELGIDAQILVREIQSRPELQKVIQDFIETTGDDDAEFTSLLEQLLLGVGETVQGVGREFGQDVPSLQTAARRGKAGGSLGEEGTQGGFGGALERGGLIRERDILKTSIDMREAQIEQFRTVGTPLGVAGDQAGIDTIQKSIDDDLIRLGEIDAQLEQGVKLVDDVVVRKETVGKRVQGELSEIAVTETDRINALRVTRGATPEQRSETVMDTIRQLSEQGITEPGDEYRALKAVSGQSERGSYNPAFLTDEYLKPLREAGLISPRARVPKFTAAGRSRFSELQRQQDDFDVAFGNLDDKLNDEALSAAEAGLTPRAPEFIAGENEGWFQGDKFRYTGETETAPDGTVFYKGVFLEGLKEGDELVVTTPPESFQLPSLQRPPSQYPPGRPPLGAAFKLPSELERSRVSPFFGGKQSNIVFESDFDRALYIATAKKRSKQRDTFEALVREEFRKRGLDPGRMTEIAAPMKRAVQEAAQVSDEIEVPFSAFRYADEAVTPAPAARQVGEAARRGAVDLNEKLAPDLRYPAEFFSPQSHIQDVGGEVPRYWYHSRLPENVVPRPADGGIEPSKIAQTQAADAFGGDYAKGEYIWLSPTPIRDKPLIIDISKLSNNDMRFTGQVEGNLLHRGFIHESAIVEDPTAAIAPAARQVDEAAEVVVGVRLTPEQEHAALLAFNQQQANVAFNPAAITDEIREDFLERGLIKRLAVPGGTDVYPLTNEGGALMRGLFDDLAQARNVAARRQTVEERAAAGIRARGMTDAEFAEIAKPDARVRITGEFDERFPPEIDQLEGYGPGVVFTVDRVNGRMLSGRTDDGSYAGIDTRHAMAELVEDVAPILDVEEVTRRVERSFIGQRSPGDIDIVKSAKPREVLDLPTGPLKLRPGDSFHEALEGYRELILDAAENGEFDVVVDFQNQRDELIFGLRNALGEYTGIDSYGNKAIIDPDDIDFVNRTLASREDDLAIIDSRAYGQDPFDDLLLGHGIKINQRPGYPGAPYDKNGLPQGVLRKRGVTGVTDTTDPTVITDETIAARILTDLGQTDEFMGGVRTDAVTRLLTLIDQRIAELENVKSLRLRQETALPDLMRENLVNVKEAEFVPQIGNRLSLTFDSATNGQILQGIQENEIDSRVLALANERLLARPLKTKAAAQKVVNQAKRDVDDATREGIPETPTSSLADPTQEDVNRIFQEVIDSNSSALLNDEKALDTAFGAALQREGFNPLRTPVRIAQQNADVTRETVESGIPGETPVEIAQPASREAIFSGEHPMLPSNLSRSGTNFGSKKIFWESDVDRALYIANPGSKTPSKFHHRFVIWLHDLGFTDEQISISGMAIKTRVKLAARDVGGDIRVPASNAEKILNMTEEEILALYPSAARNADGSMAGFPIAEGSFRGKPYNAFTEYELVKMGRGGGFIGEWDPVTGDFRGTPISAFTPAQLVEMGQNPKMVVGEYVDVTGDFRGTHSNFFTPEELVAMGRGGGGGRDSRGNLIGPRYSSPGVPIGNQPNLLTVEPDELAADFFGMRPITSTGMTFSDNTYNVAKRLLAIGSPEAPTLRLPIVKGAMDERKRLLNEVIPNMATQRASKIENLANKVFSRNSKGQILTLEGKDTTLKGAPTVQDIAARLPRFAPYLTSEQLAAMEEIRSLLRPLRQLLNDMKIELGSRSDIMQGGFYIPRGSAWAEGIDLAEVPKSREVAVGGPAGFEGFAPEASMAEGIQNGLEYLPLSASINGYVREVGIRTTNRHVANYFKQLTDLTGRPFGLPPQIQDVTGKAINLLPGQAIPESALGKGNIQIAGISHLNFPKEVAAAVQIFLRDEGATIGKNSQWLRVINDYNNMYVAGRSTLDNSALAIQGLLAGANDPRAFGRALRLNYQVWRHGDGVLMFGKFLEDFDNMVATEGRLNSESWARYGLAMRGGDTEFTNPGILTRIPGVQRASDAFGTFGDALRLSAADDELALLMKGGKSIDDISPKDIEKLVMAINRMTGVGSRNQFTDLGSILLFAPRFLDSRIRTILAAARGTVKALIPGLHASLDERIARRALIRLFGLATALTVAINGVQGHTTDLRPIVDGRYNSNFLRIRFGDRDWTLLGTWDSIARLMVSTATAGFHRDPGELLGAFRGLSSGLVTQLWDVMSGRDFEGRKTGGGGQFKENPLEAALNFAVTMLRNHSPFFADELAEGGVNLYEAGESLIGGDTLKGINSLGETAVIVGGELIGGKQSHLGVGDQLAEITEARFKAGEVSQDTYAAIESHEKTEQRRLYGDQLNIRDRGDNNSKYYNRLDDIDAKRLGQQEEALEFLTNGLDSLGNAFDRKKFRTLIYNAENDARISRRNAKEDFGIEFDDDTSSHPLQFVLDGWYDLYEQATTPEGNFLGYLLTEDQVNKVTGEKTLSLQTEYILPLSDPHFEFLFRNINTREHVDGVAEHMPDKWSKGILQSEQEREDFKERLKLRREANPNEVNPGILNFKVETPFGRYWAAVP